MPVNRVVVYCESKARRAFIYRRPAGQFTDRRYKLMMANGVAIERIRDWVGHSDIRTTVNTYGHLEYQSKKETAAAIQNSLPLKMAVAANP